MHQTDALDLHVTWHDQQPAELLTQVGEWLERQGYSEQAMSYYDAAIALEPTYSLAAFRGGQLALEMRQCEEALKRLMVALSLTPEHAPTHYLVSKAYLCLEKYNDALAQAEATLHDDPNHSGAFLVKLRCLKATQRWEEIERLYSTDAAQFSSSSEASLILILALCHRGDLSRAQALYATIPTKQRKRFHDLTCAIESCLSNTP
jgi:tetratricopeptide (TPR) repeat protein